ncbi:MAG TPA: type II toxin-antitoxin system VapC family toxin [Steroidobacteraceae bacterium]
MVLDTSAVLAILFDEPERRLFSAASFVETSMILESRHGAEGVRALDRLLAAATVEIVAVDLAQAQAAREAFRQYGKGRHPAALSFGDCFPYALAKCRAEPLLFKGVDFSRTDVLSA